MSTIASVRLPARRLKSTKQKRLINMSRYQQTPVFVEAFQMTEEAEQNIQSWPEWAIKCAELDNRKIGAIFTTDPNTTNNGYSLRTDYGVFLIPRENWVVKGDSTYMIIQDIQFRASFAKSPEQDKKDEKEAVDNKVTSEDKIQNPKTEKLTEPVKEKIAKAA